MDPKKDDNNQSETLTDTRNPSHQTHPLQSGSGGSNPVSVCHIAPPSVRNMPRRLPVSPRPRGMSVPSPLPSAQNQPVSLPTAPASDPGHEDRVAPPEILEKYWYLSRYLTRSFGDPSPLSQTYRTRRRTQSMGPLTGCKPDFLDFLRGLRFYSPPESPLPGRRVLPTVPYELVQLPRPWMSQSSPSLSIFDGEHYIPSEEGGVRLESEDSSDGEAEQQGAITPPELTIAGAGISPSTSPLSSGTQSTGSSVVSRVAQQLPTPPDRQTSPTRYGHHLPVPSSTDPGGRNAVCPGLASSYRGTEFITPPLSPALEPRDGQTSSPLGGSPTQLSPTRTGTQASASPPKSNVLLPSSLNASDPGTHQPIPPRIHLEAENQPLSDTKNHSKYAKEVRKHTTINDLDHYILAEVGRQVFEYSKSQDEQCKKLLSSILDGSEQASADSEGEENEQPDTIPNLTQGLSNGSAHLPPLNGKGKERYGGYHYHEGSEAKAVAPNGQAGRGDLAVTDGYRLDENGTSSSKDGALLETTTRRVDPAKTNEPNTQRAFDLAAARNTLKYLQDRVKADDAGPDSENRRKKQEEVLSKVEAKLKLISISSTGVGPKLLKHPDRQHISQLEKDLMGGDGLGIRNFQSEIIVRPAQENLTHAELRRLLQERDQVIEELRAELRRQQRLTSTSDDFDGIAAAVGGGNSRAENTTVAEANRERVQNTDNAGGDAARNTHHDGGQGPAGGDSSNTIDPNELNRREIERIRREQLEEEMKELSKGELHYIFRRYGEDE